MTKSSHYNINIPLSEFNEAYRTYIDNFDRYNLFYGGSSSGKSYFLGERYLYRLLKYPGRNLMGLRKVANKARGSVFALFKQLIYKWGLQDLLHVNKQEMKIEFPNRNMIICTGLDDPDKIKSFTADYGIFTDIWIEEAAEVNYEDFQQADLRLRGESELPKQLTMSFNPVSHLHWSKSFFFDNPTDYHAENLTWLKTTYRDNLAHLTEDDVRAIENIPDENMRRIYMDGEWGVLGDMVYTNWDVVDSVPEHKTRVFYGVDFGFSVDPAVLLRITQVGDRDYYVEELIYQTGLTNSDFANLAKQQGVGEYDLIFADSAEPKAIEELRLYGMRGVKPCTKGRDSLKTGIDYVKTKQIHIVKGSQDTLNEIQVYQHAKDRDGNTLPTPVDYKNHAMDAMRYGIYSANVERGTIKMVGW